MNIDQSTSLFSSNDKIAIIILLVSGSLYLYDVSPMFGLLLIGDIKDLTSNTPHDLLPFPINMIAMITCTVSGLYFFRERNNCP